MPPYSGPHAAPPIIYIVEFTLRIHHMRHTGLDITHRAMLRTGNVPIAHQRHTVAIDADDAVYNPPAAFNPCQHHIADADIVRLLQDDALPAANDKRQHASPVHRQRHTHVLAHQPHSLVQYLPVSNHKVQCSKNKVSLLLRPAGTPDAIPPPSRPAHSPSRATRRPHGCPTACR